MPLTCPRIIPRPPAELCSAPRQEEPESSMKGSSCCSVGRLLWLSRLQNCPISRESPRRSDPTRPSKRRSPNGHQAATSPSKTWTQRTRQETMLSLKWTSDKSRPPAGKQFLT